MPEPRKKSKFWRVVKYSGCSVLCLLLIFIGLVIWALTRPDSPPFDDSAMLPQRPRVPSGQNGYDAVMKALGRDEKLPKNYFGDLKWTNNTKKTKLVP